MAFHSSFRAPFAYRLYLLLFLFWTAGLPAAAELAEPVLVADFSPGASAVNFAPEALTAIHGLLYFAGPDVQHGWEPWVSDGTTAGTRRLADLCPGLCWSYPANFLALGARVLIYGSSTKTLYALAGDQVEELAVLGEGYARFVRLGSILFVLVHQNGFDLVYRSDGTREGTRLSSDFCSPTGGCVWPEAIGEVLYFWRAGELFQLVAEGHVRSIAPLAFAASSFTALDAGRVIFRSCVGDGSFCPSWVTDGTQAGTFPLEAEPGRLTDGARAFVAWRGRVYFTNAAMEIVSTDGTLAGTRLENAFAGSAPKILATTDNFLFYSVSSSSSASALAILRAVDPAGRHVELLAGVADLVLLGRLDDKLFLSYRQDGTRLVGVTDGTPDGTTLLVTGLASPPAAVLGNLLYFSLDRLTGDTGGLGLWQSDGTAAGTRQLDLGATESRSSWVIPHRLGDALLLEGEFGPSRSPLRLDPATLAFEPADPQGRSLEVLAGNDRMVYAKDVFNAAEQPLVAISPTAVADIPVSRAYGAAFGDDGHLYFSDGGAGQKLWESDGTVAGTHELIDLLPGWMPCSGPHACNSPSPTSITPSGDRVFLTVQADGGYSSIPWVWQRSGPEAHAIPLLPEGHPVAALTAGRALFSSNDLAGLWVSDGSAGGTFPIFQSAVGFVRRVGSLLYFEQGSPEGSWLWMIDPETLVFRRLTSEPVAYLAAPVALGDRVVFRASRNGHSNDTLGVSDGTPEGTRWLDVGAGFPASGLEEDPFGVDRENFVFAGLEESTGYELWISDGTPAGTHRLTDLAPGPESSSPNHFAVVGRRLFFQANGGGLGREFWALDLPPLAPCRSDRLCLMDDRFEVEVTAFTEDGAFLGRRAAGNADAGVFTFFSADNWEMLVKVLDGCAINEKRWVFAAIATDVGWTLKVTDRQTGEQKVYSGPSGEPARAVTDTAAFACDPR